MEYSNIDMKKFKYLYLSDNDYISKLSNNDLVELTNYISKYLLSFRETLNLSDDDTFGLEIEYHAFTNDKKIQKEVLIYEDWNLKKEDYKIFEIISPVLTDDINSWNKLKSICTILGHYGNINKDCGGHIHIGTQVLGNSVKSWLNFVKIWSIYESVIYKFSAGEFYSSRPDISLYANQCRDSFIETYDYSVNYMVDNVNDIINKTDCLIKGLAINFANVANIDNFEYDNTIEIRCPNGSLNEVVWQNNVNFFVKLLKLCKYGVIDDEYINHLYLKKKSKKYSYLYYNYTNLDLAVDLVDLVFDNNLDKVYFLRQYLRDFNDTYINDLKGLQKSKKFTM